MTDHTNAERQARYAARVRKQGLVKICEWIPAECRDTLKRVAAELRGDEPEPEPAAPRAPSEPGPRNDTAAKVWRAHGWGWAPDAIAAYLGIEVADVKRILGE
jgi:hypothetical protein